MFLFSALEAIGMLAGLLFALPWTLVLLPAERRTLSLVALTTLALSLGALTLWLLLLALLDTLTLGAALAGLAVLFSVGIVAAARWGDWRVPRMTFALPRGVLVRGVALVVLGIAALIAFDALYWPFSDADAVAIYANHSRAIFQAGGLPEGEGLYESYPMLLPLSYVYAYLLAGGINAYLARIVIAALAAGTFGAAFELGRTLFNAATGLTAALLLALTPSFARWGPSGYADIPAAFFVTLALVFAARLARSGGARDALLLGSMTGLATWTKNSTLPFAASMGVWVAALLWTRRVAWRAAAWALVAVLATAGPWYLRNVLLWGHLVAPTAWTDLAQHTARNLVPFLAYPDRFLAAGIAFTAGIVWALGAAWRGAAQDRFGARLVLLGILPLAAAWWWMASYDSRFLLAVLPAVAVIGARALQHAWDALETRFAITQARALHVALLVVVIVLALPSARKALSHKGDLARDPLMDSARRYELALGPVVDVADYVRALPAEGRLLTDNNFLPFLAEHEGRREVIVGGLPERAALARYDYLVLARDLPDVVTPGDVELLATIDRFRVYRVTYR